jgi:hypothetical protein
MAQNTPAVLGPVESSVRPRAWLCEYRSGEEFLSFAADPMNDPDVMSAVPLVLRSALTLEHSEIEARCRKAFLLEDGYGVPSEHPERYRVFRDGFFAAWMRARADLGA